MRLCMLGVVCVLAAAAQNSPDDFKVYTDYPRLLLKPQRLRLLKRERDRQSMRWTQLETLFQGKAQMPEPAFTSALMFQVTGDAEAAKAAIETAVRPGTEIRQTALVWDWCQGAMTPAQNAQLRDKLERSLTAPVTTVAAARDRAFAAIGLGNGAALQQVVMTWWRKSTAPDLLAGTRSLEHADMYPFTELIHVLRDNLQIDLRDDILPLFKDLALRRLLSYYPAPYPAAENEYHIPYYDGKGEPDLRLAALTRASELALVAYESNAQEMQFLQGWLLRDRFALRGSFGAPYEFLWANPYQPGLPFEKLPPFIHEERTGTLLIRSSWEDDATWLAVSGAFIQMFREGQVRAASLKEPLEIGQAMVMAGPPVQREFRVTSLGPEHWYLLGLKRNASYDLETDDEEMTDITTDCGGIADLQFPRRVGQAVYVHEPRTEQGAQ